VQRGSPQFGRGGVVPVAGKQVRALCAQIGQRRNLSVDWKVLQVSSPVACDAKMKEGLASAIQAAGYEPLSLVSGRGMMPFHLTPCRRWLCCLCGVTKGSVIIRWRNVETEDLAAVIVISDNFIQTIVRVSWKYQH